MAEQPAGPASSQHARSHQPPARAPSHFFLVHDFFSGWWWQTVNCNGQTVNRHSLSDPLFSARVSQERRWDNSDNILVFFNFSPSCFSFRKRLHTPTEPTLPAPGIFWSISFVWIKKSFVLTLLLHFPSCIFLV